MASRLAVLLVAGALASAAAAEDDPGRILDRRVSFVFEEADIETVAERLALIGGVTVRLDASIRERREEIPPMTLKVDDISLRNTLAWLRALTAVHHDFRNGELVLRMQDRDDYAPAHRKVIRIREVFGTGPVQVEIEKRR